MTSSWRTCRRGAEAAVHTAPRAPRRRARPLRRSPPRHHAARASSLRDLRRPPSAAQPCASGPRLRAARGGMRRAPPARHRGGRGPLHTVSNFKTQRRPLQPRRARAPPSDAPASPPPNTHIEVSASKGSLLRCTISFVSLVDIFQSLVARQTARNWSPGSRYPELHGGNFKVEVVWTNPCSGMEIEIPSILGPDNMDNMDES